MELTTEIEIIEDRDLFNIHKDLLKSFMDRTTNWKANQKTKVMKLYQAEVSPDNIRLFNSRHIKIFLVALIHGQLESIKNYFPKEQ